jgi:hypothetical protein
MNGLVSQAKSKTYDSQTEQLKLNFVRPSLSLLLMVWWKI